MTDNPAAPHDGPLPDPVLARLETLSGTLDTIAARIGTVAGREAKTRRLARGLAISLVLDVVLTVVVTILTFTAIHDASSVRQAQVSLHTAQITACQIGNTGRMQQLQLWDFLFKLSGPNANTPQDKQLLAYIRKTFQPLNCTKLYG
jgi:hypothetical protein